jgi:hypothetical protein
VSDLLEGLGRMPLEVLEWWAGDVRLMSTRGNYGRGSVMSVLIRNGFYTQVHLKL